MSKVVKRPRLSYMIRDLQKIKEAYNLFITVQTIHDDFGSQKRQLTELVDQIRENLTTVQRLRVRDARSVTLKHQNRKLLQEGEVVWLRMKKICESGVQKNLNADISDEQRRWLQFFGDELVKFKRLNYGITESTHECLVTKLTQGRQAAALQRANRRADRRAARLGAVEIEMEAPLDFEQTFFQEVNDSDIKMDDLLDVISNGLSELKELATHIGLNLDAQNQQLQQTDKKMETTENPFESANVRLQRVVEQSCGVEVWCPVIVLSVILLCIVGVLISMV